MGAVRGYFGIGIYHGKTEENIGTLWRSAYAYGADFVFTAALHTDWAVEDYCFNLRTARLTVRMAVEVMA
jgi:hypothetical protein